MVSLRIKGFLILLFLLGSCVRPGLQAQSTANIRLGIERTNEYLPLLQGKSVGLVVNHTSIFPNKTHLADSLLALGIHIKTIFSPEHGFRGTADAGEHISSGVDTKTGLPIVSLYGSNRKPTPEQIKDIDILLFDIQDVGARFYTYTSTMHYVMEAAAEQGKTVLILDRPNPNGHYIEGPVLDRKFASFVGLNPIPTVHGCTIAELARMINGEGWLKDGKICKLITVSCEHYSHSMPYTLPVAPSPNLPNQQSILLYPSICIFEATEISVGRGTDTQFQVIGGPSPSFGTYAFTPEPKPGAMDPPNKGKVCYGLDLRKVNAWKEGYTLKYLIEMYQKAPDKSKFITNIKSFDILSGTDQVRLQLLAGKSESEIRNSWKSALKQYQEIRKKYLLYL
ncbi:MAG: DUF1343 domain-containing protein [Siphonobacter sp.]